MVCKLNFDQRSKNLISRIRHRYYLHKMLKELKFKGHKKANLVKQTKSSQKGSSWRKAI